MARKAKKKSKGMGIKTSVKSGNFLPTSKGAGMTKKGVAAYRRANPGQCAHAGHHRCHSLGGFSGEFYTAKTPVYFRHYPA